MIRKFGRIKISFKKKNIIIEIIIKKNVWVEL